MSSERRTKIGPFGSYEKHYAWRKENLISAVKHGGGSFVAWAMNSKPILKENIRTSGCELNLKRKRVMQQDNKPKHTSRSTQEWLEKV